MQKDIKSMVFCVVTSRSLKQAKHFGEIYRPHAHSAYCLLLAQFLSLTLKMEVTQFSETLGIF
jgi:hypothetical protein